MTLMVTRGTRRTAIATLVLLGGQLAGPAAWPQTPAPPKAAGAPAAPAKPATPTVVGTLAVPPEASGNRPWPREATEGGRTYTVYQPQVEKWDGVRLHFRAAVSVESVGSSNERFGVVWFSARAEVDRANRLVALAEFKIDKLAFPAEPDRAAEYQKVLERRLPRDAAHISLDRVQAALAITEAQINAAAPQAVKNDPPRVIFSERPAVLALVDGKPVLRQVEGSSLQRVVNTWALILVDKGSGKHYLRAIGLWFEAAAVDGPWGPSTQAPAALGPAMQAVAKSQRVNLLDDPGGGVKDAAARGVLPTIYVSTVPAELIQSRGRPDYEPIEDTDLLHVRNSSAHILLDSTDQRHYVLLSGRWFRSRSLTEGPWEYVPHDKLPASFAKIPETHPRGAVLASIAGTPQAKEALIDNGIPQTAEVSRTTTTYQATYDGAPKFAPITGTSLHYAANSPVPVIQVDAKTYYSLKDGVWFVAAAPTGPWTVATSVPAVIYTIPVSSPLYYVTHVQVYGSTPQVVHVGYTPGYYGTVVEPTGVVVYGTGYVYEPVYVGAYYYPAPVTYGYGAGFAWGAVTGFAFGAVTAAVWGGAWGCCRHYHDDIDFDRTVNINRSDAYRSWSQGQVRSNVQSRAQSLTPEQRQRAQQAASQRGSATRSNDVYAGRDGSTYRRGSQGWEQNAGQGWSRASFSGAGESAANLNRQQQARSTGAAREASYQRSGGAGAAYSGGARSSGGGARAGGGGGRRR